MARGDISPSSFERSCCRLDALLHYMQYLELGGVRRHAVHARPPGRTSRRARARYNPSARCWRCQKRRMIARRKPTHFARSSPERLDTATRLRA